MLEYIKLKTMDIFKLPNSKLQHFSHSQRIVLWCVSTSCTVFKLENHSTYYLILFLHHNIYYTACIEGAILMWSIFYTTVYGISLEEHSQKESERERERENNIVLIFVSRTLGTRTQKTHPS